MSIAALITEGIGPGGTIPFLLTGGLGAGVAPPPTPSGPTPAGRHHRHRKLYAQEFEGRLIIADSKEELTRKLAALRREEPQALAEEPVEVLVDSEAVPEPVRVLPYEPRPAPPKPFEIPSPAAPLDMGLAGQAVEARLRFQEQHARRMTIEADDEDVLAALLQIEDE